MMTPKRLTFVDSSVLINAIVGKDAARKMRALSVLGDPDREFVATFFLELEVLPIPTKYSRQKEAAFYRRFLDGVSTWIAPDQIMQPAFDLACKYGLGAIDSLHVAAAIVAGAEFVSAEKPTKPIYAAYAGAVSIY
jgi:predicted nucleic acid-binding protein